MSSDGPPEAQPQPTPGPPGGPDPSAPSSSVEPAAPPLSLAAKQPSPLLLAVVPILMTAAGAVIGAWFQGRQNIEVERHKFEQQLQLDTHRAQSDLILKAIGTGKPDEAKANLLLLAETGLLGESGEKIRTYLNKPGTPIPVLPASGSPIQQTENSVVGPVRWRAVGNTAAGSTGRRREVRFEDQWDEKNIEPVTIPQLAGVATGTSGRLKDGTIKFNKAGAEQLKAVFNEIEQKGLLKLVRSFDGSYYPTTTMGSSQRLSTHALGIAIDINAAWNSTRKVVPAGQPGSVVEMVPIFKKYGFRWGGDYAGFKDPAHFEIEKRMERESP